MRKIWMSVIINLILLVLSISAPAFGAPVVGSFVAILALILLIQVSVGIYYSVKQHEREIPKGIPKVGITLSIISTPFYFLGGITGSANLSSAIESHQTLGSLILLVSWGTVAVMIIAAILFWKGREKSGGKLALTFSVICLLVSLATLKFGGGILLALISPLGIGAGVAGLKGK